jgi:putative membrane protein
LIGAGGMNAGSVFSFASNYCGSPAVWADLWGRWNFDPVLILGLILSATAGFYKLRGQPTRRRVAFGAALLLAAILFVSPLCALTVSLFSVRVVHHVLLMMVVAPLLVIASPARWLSKGKGLGALALSSAALWIWHAPDAYLSTYANPALYWLMQLSLLGSAYWLWSVLMRGSATVAAGTALASAIQMGLLGALLVFAPDALYLPHLATTAEFGLSPLEDQQLAGLILWVPANLPLLGVVLFRLVGGLSPKGAPRHVS